MGTLWRDLRYAARVLRQAPGFAAIAITVLALGIGANSAIFSLVEAALLRPLPYANPGALVRLYEKPPQFDRNAVSPLNFLDWSEQNHVFSAMAAVSGDSKTLVAPDGAEKIPGQSVTRQFFDVLGVAPIAGRTFSAEDEKPGNRIVVLSERMWRGRFGARREVVGSVITFDGQPYRVIGVMPASFEILARVDFWSLFVVKRSPEQRQMHYLRVLGRLKDDVRIEQAQAAMNVIAKNLEVAVPDTNKGWGITLVPLREAMVEQDLHTTSLVLACVVGLVLLMACANVANLLLARSAERAREVAVRAALGGSQGRILAQLLTESGLLAVLGGAVGVALAWMIVKAAPSLMPPETLPSGITLRLDAGVVAFSAVVTIVTGLLFGSVPAWHAARASFAEALRTGGRAATRTGAFRSVLAAGEIAVAVLLVAGAGLLVRTLASLAAVDTGIRTEHVLTMQLGLSDTRYRGRPERRLGFYQSVLREVESLPGVRSVAFSTILPLEGWDIGQAFELVDQPAPDPSHQLSAHYQMVSPRYFETLGISLLAGRRFDEHDDVRSTQVCIVNEDFVRRYLAGRAALGTKVTVQAMGETKPEPMLREIVGVIRQVKVDGPGEKQASPEIYVPLAQNTWYWGALSVRTAGDPLAMTSAVKSAIARIDKNQPVTRVRSMEEVATEVVAQPRFRAELVGAFAILSLVLAAAGVFGVLAFAVSQRTREFGIRMALGAKGSDILRLVLTGGVRIIVPGIAIGLIAAIELAQFVSSLLFGVKPMDAVTFVAAPAILATIALAACAAPALRAARVDPAIALRQE